MLLFLWVVNDMYHMLTDNFNITVENEFSIKMLINII